MLKIFKREPKPLNNSISNINSLVREGDNLFSDELILLAEKLSGNLFCAEKIVVEQSGMLSGNITSKQCVVSGTINGNIVSTDQMEIKSTAIIKGNIKTAQINIEPGAVINGTVTIAEDRHAITNLSKKINAHSTDAYLSAKLAGDSVSIHQVDAPATLLMAKQDEPKPENAAVKPQLQIPVKKEEPRDVPPLQDTPPVFSAPPVKAAEPKQHEPPKQQEENNQRWW